MAGAVRRSWRYREVFAAATRREQTLGQRERRSDGTLEEKHPAAGGVGAESLQGGRREGGEEGEGVQDAAGCESDCDVRENISLLSLTSELPLFTGTLMKTIAVSVIK